MNEQEVISIGKQAIQLTIWKEVKDYFIPEKKELLEKITALLNVDLDLLQDKLNWEHPTDFSFKINGRMGTELSTILKLQISQNCLCEIKFNTLQKIITTTVKSLNTFLPEWKRVTNKRVYIKHETDFRYNVSIHFNL